MAPRMLMDHDNCCSARRKRRTDLLISPGAFGVLKNDAFRSGRGKDLPHNDPTRIADIKEDIPDDDDDDDVDC